MANSRKNGGHSKSLPSSGNTLSNVGLGLPPPQQEAPYRALGHGCHEAFPEPLGAQDEPHVAWKVIGLHEAGGSIEVLDELRVERVELLQGGPLLGEEAVQGLLGPHPGQGVHRLLQGLQRPLYAFVEGIATALGAAVGETGAPPAADLFGVHAVQVAAPLLAHRGVPDDRAQEVPGGPAEVAVHAVEANRLAGLLLCVRTEKLEEEPPPEFVLSEEDLEGAEARPFEPPPLGLWSVVEEAL